MARMIMIVFGLVFFTLMIIQSVLMMIPFLKQMQFDDLCYQYSARVIREGSLDGIDEQLMTGEMENMGIENMSCEFSSAEAEDPFIITIQASLPVKLIGPDLSMKEVMLPLSYKITSMLVEKPNLPQ